MSKLRCLTSQLCACIPYYCLIFTVGSSIGFHVLVIAELHDQNSEIPATIDELSWFASLDVIKFIGSIVSGLLMHYLSCRSSAFIISLLYITSYVLYYNASNVTMVIIARVLTSLTASMIISGSYISEISQAQLRGRLLSMGYLCMSIGSFFTLLLATFVYWRHIALVNLVFPALTSLTIFATPNSPTWLATKGRLDEAEKALCWLRGWVKAEQVQNELQALMEIARQSKSKADDKPIGCQESLRKFYKFFLQRSLYLPLGTLCVMFLVFTCSGAEVTFTYSRVILSKMNSPIEETLATAIMGALIVIGQLMLLLTIRRFGKRKLIMTFVIVSGLCLATAAIIGFFQLNGIFSWIAPITIIIATFVNYSGIESILQMLIVEIFPSHVRYIGTSIVAAITLTMGAIMSKWFLYMVEAMTMNGVFALYVIMNVVSFFTYYCLFPETEGMSLQDLEDRYKNVKRSTTKC